MKGKMTEPARDLSAYLAGRREAVDRALDRFLPRADAPPARLHEAMRYSVFSGGKRLRPILAIASFELSGGEGDAVLAPACAAELIHTYSLIHDDLPAMDDDDLRRGRPTCHRAFGEAVAVLAGDALLTLAFEIVAREPGLSDGARLAIIGELARANGSEGMVGGQAADIGAEGLAPTVESVEFIHARKTAAPLAAAVLVGALAAREGERRLSALRSYGRSIGLAFQIADDILDVTGSEAVVGKAVGKDVAGGKLTYPGTVGIGEARARARDLTEEAVSALDGFGDEAWALREIARFVIERTR
jgi:geranylgeranyl diphosphate synthase type II